MEQQVYSWKTNLNLHFFLHILCSEEEDKLSEVNQEFTKEMNAIADGNPPDIKAATDDTTFERKSRDLVKLYRYVTQQPDISWWIY